MSDLWTQTYRTIRIVRCDRCAWYCPTTVPDADERALAHYQTAHGFHIPLRLWEWMDLHCVPEHAEPVAREAVDE